MARKKKEIPGPPTVAAWLGTYGDMVTLVLTFFVLLFSFSTIDAAKWQQLVESFAGKTPSFINDGQPLDIPNPPSIVENPSDVVGDEMSDQAWTEFFESLQKTFKQKEQEMQNQTGLTGELVGMEMTDSEIVIKLSESMLFDSGRYDLKPVATITLQELAIMINPELGQIASIVIEGHTDTVPVSLPTAVKNNWDLGYQRAQAVFEAMQVSYPYLAPNNFTFVSLGEEHPVYDAGDEYTGDIWDRAAYRAWVDSQNATAEQRMRNRRCVIVLKRNFAYTYVAHTPLDETTDEVSDLVPDAASSGEIEAVG